MRRWCRLTLVLIVVQAVPLWSQSSAAAPPLAPAPEWAELAAKLLSSPLVTPLLLALAVIGILLEIKAGAFGLGALVSFLALGLFFGSSLILGHAGWHEVLLLGLGMIALAVEVFVLPGFGAAGILGLLAIGTAVLLALLSGTPTPADVLQAFAVIGSSVLITAAVIYGWLRHLPNSGRFAGLFLRGGMHRSEGYVSALPRADLVGLDGVAVTDLRPAGLAQIGTERVDVVTEGEYVRQGSPVRVIRSEGYRHIVRAVA